MPDFSVDEHRPNKAIGVVLLDDIYEVAAKGAAISDNFFSADRFSWVFNFTCQTQMSKLIINGMGFLV